MDQEVTKALLIEEAKAFLSILDSKGVAFTMPVPEEKLSALSISDLKRLVGQLRDLGRTPTGSQ